jgi:hypothetical protein
MARIDYAETITYSSEDDFTFDSDYIEYDNGLKLVLVDNPGQVFSETFDSDTGHTYDSDKSEFVAGKLQQKDTRPAGSTFYSAYTSDIDATWSSGVGTGSAVNGADVAAGKLDLSYNDVRYVDYAGVGNAPLVQTGCIRFQITPNYAPWPSAEEHFFNVSKANNDKTNAIFIRHSSTGALRLQIYDSVEVSLLEMVIANPWNAVSGQTYEFEIDFDVTTGATRVFIDGVQSGSTSTATGTRDSNIGLLRIGGGYQGTTGANFKIDNFLIFTTVQHTANYTPDWSTIYETIYVDTYVDFPVWSYEGAGEIQAILPATITAQGNEQWVLEGYYWDGAAWAASDKTFAQSCTSADIAAHALELIALLGFNPSPVNTIVFPAGNTQGWIDNFDVEYVGQNYPTTNVSFETAIALTADEVLSISISETIEGSDNIKYAEKQDDTELYWDGSAWVVSSGYSTASESGDIEDNFAKLSDGDERNYHLKGYLHSDDGLTTPIFNSAIIKYFIINFVVEDGTSKTDATSYATIAQYVQYWLDKGFDRSSISVTSIKQRLNSATEYIDITYNFKGQKTDANQALEWPRYNVQKEDKSYSYAYNNYYDSDEIPDALIKATCYYADKASEEINATETGLRSIRVGPISKTFSGSSDSTKYKTADKLLSDLIISGNTLVRVN